MAKQGIDGGGITAGLRSDIEKSHNNAGKTFLYAYLLSLNVIPNKKQADCKSS